MANTKVLIEGMSCMHCVGRVQKAIEGLQGVTAAKVDIGTAEVTFDDSRLSQAEIEAAITQAGYKIKA